MTVGCIIFHLVADFLQYRWLCSIICRNPRTFNVLDCVRRTQVWVWQSFSCCMQAFQLFFKCDEVWVVHMQKSSTVCECQCKPFLGNPKSVTHGVQLYCKCLHRSDRSSFADSATSASYELSSHQSSCLRQWCRTYSVLEPSSHQWYIAVGAAFLDPFPIVVSCLCQDCRLFLVY